MICREIEIVIGGHETIATLTGLDWSAGVNCSWDTRLCSMRPRVLTTHVF